MSTSVFRRVSISRTYPSRLFLLLGNKLKFCYAIVIPTSHTQKDPCPVYYRLCNTSLWRQCISVLIWRRCSKVRCQLYNLHNRLCDTSLWRQSISVLIWRRCSESDVNLRFPRCPPLFLSGVCRPCLLFSFLSLFSNGSYTTHTSWYWFQYLLWLKKCMTFSKFDCTILIHKHCL